MNPAPQPLPGNVIRNEYEVRNPKGVTLMTAPERDLAVQFVKDKAHTFPGLYVDHVVVTETRTRAYKPRALTVVR